MFKVELKKSRSKPKTLMSHFDAFTIKNKFEVEVIEAKKTVQLSDSDLSLVEKIWQNEQKKRRLFDGELLNAHSYDQNRLEGAFIPYKLFIAQLAEPSLKSTLKIVPVSVSGLTLLGKNVIIGKRSSNVTQFPGFYELAPSGGVGRDFIQENRIDIRKQFQQELEEEIGIPAKKVKGFKLFALVHDHQLDLIDICAEIKVKPSALQTISREYSQIMTIPCEELPAFLEQNKEQFVPLSLLLLKLRKFIA